MSKYNGKNYLYIKVSRDKYEFPLIVTDSVKEMAELDHTTENSVSSSISNKRGTYYRVEVEDDV